MTKESTEEKGNKFKKNIIFYVINILMAISLAPVVDDGKSFATFVFVLLIVFNCIYMWLLPENAVSFLKIYIERKILEEKKKLKTLQDE